MRACGVRPVYVFPWLTPPLACAPSTQKNRYMAVAWWEGKATLSDCARLWAISWAGNFAGTAAVVGLMVAGGTFDSKAAYTLLLATKKARARARPPFGAACTLRCLGCGCGRRTAGHDQRYPHVCPLPLIPPPPAPQTRHGFGPCLVLGVLCNFLVCLATWMANAAQDVAGKFIAIWWARGGGGVRRCWGVGGLRAHARCSGHQHTAHRLH